MTLRNINKILDRYESQLGYTSSSNQYESLKGLPFYNFQNPKDKDTFNNVIGLPKKGGVEHNLYDYERLLFNTLETNKHLWLKKASGLGITEFVLRYIAWLCVRDNSLKGAQMCIVTGPRIELAITLISRLKGLFTEKQFI
jgi:late competence protein required for DNA uptake (superfamily II DNA/RNA helicase)